MPWPPGCRAPWRNTGPGSCASPRSPSLRTPPPSSTTRSPGSPRSWCSAGRASSPPAGCARRSRRRSCRLPRRRRRSAEDATRDARVERWAEDSGNAALMGRELPPAEVLAADQRITAWAHELRKAGLDGDMDVLRARAYLDLLLGQDSRPEPGDGPAPQDMVPGGFAVRGTLTVPLATLTGAADRPGHMGGFGPVDPWLAR